MNNYWTKDHTRKEIITKTQIPNKRNFNIYANYYNLIDQIGLSFQLNCISEVESEKLFRIKGFEYFVLDQDNQKELYILPNESIREYINRIAFKIDFCNDEAEVFRLLTEEMN